MRRLRFDPLFVSLSLVALACSGTGGEPREFTERAAEAEDADPAEGGNPGIEGGLNPGASSGDDAQGANDTDCDPTYYDFPGNGLDEDCSGTPDDGPESCDGAITDLAASDPFLAASAIGLCVPAVGENWGVVDARYVLVDGSKGMHELGHGLLSSFGVVGPREGSRLLALSSGTARTPADKTWVAPVNQGGLEGGFWAVTESATPEGFPGTFTNCKNGEVGTPKAFDGAALELELRAPPNASGFAFDLNFYTAEFPNYLCTRFNDYYVSIMSPPPPGHLFHNISFDTNGDPISVNAGFVNVCSAGTYEGRKFDCPNGPLELNETGFEHHAASGWLTTTAPLTVAENGTFLLRFALWDAGDMNLDSTVLIDNFRWVEGDLPDRPSTEPAPR